MNVAEHTFHFVTASYLTPEWVAVLEGATIRLETARLGGELTFSGRLVSHFLN